MKYRVLVLALALACAHTTKPRVGAWLTIDHISKVNDGILVEFTLHNSDSKEFRYRGYTPDTVVPEQQHRSLLGWHSAGFVCLTGMGTFVVPSGSQQKFARVMPSNGDVIRIGLPNEITGDIAWSVPFAARAPN